MPYATTTDKVKLYYEEIGSGSPILFVHEFAGDYRNWELQMRYFSRRHRCITYSARGYKPSDVPADASSYGYKHFASDALAVLDHLQIPKAHVVGLSMGGYSVVVLGMNHPDRLISLTAAGTGSGSEPSRGPAHTRSSAGHPAHAKSLGVGRNSPSRIRAITEPSSSPSVSTSVVVKVAETGSAGASRNW